MHESNSKSTVDPGFLELLPVAACAVDANGKLTLWNGQMVALTGQPAAVVLGKKAWNGLLKQRGATPIDEALSTGETVEDSFTVVHKASGDTVSVTFKATPVFAQDHEDPVGAIATLTPAAGKSEALNLQAAIDGATLAMMTVDRELVVTYANPATAALMRENAAAFRRAFPSFDPSKLVGTCIDVFQPRPEHQRRLLSDPRNLPHRADIRVAELCFEINVSAMLDGAGAYVGCALEWKDVTRQRQQEDQAARLQSAIAGSSTPMMMVDRALKVTYANAATLELMRKHHERFRSAYPSFDSSALIGTCVDILHPKPEQQRRLLAEPRNLPHREDIEVAGLMFELNMSAMLDAKGEYIGAVLEWRDVTAA
jgi:PAS domain S-box-containing protein